MDGAGPQLSILIPALNERGNLERLLPQLNQLIQHLGLAAEVLVLDGGSRDGTPAAAEGLGARVVQQTERGYGGALLAGFAAAGAPYLITMDADLSHPPAVAAELWRRRGEADIVIASRYTPGGRATMPVARLLLSRLLNTVFAVTLGLRIRDLSSGFRCYRKAVLHGLEPRGRDFDFLEEVLALAVRRGATAVEAPFHYQPRVEGASHAHILKFGWAYLKLLARMRLA